MRLSRVLNEICQYTSDAFVSHEYVRPENVINNDDSVAYGVITGLSITAMFGFEFDMMLKM